MQRMLLNLLLAFFVATFGIWVSGTEAADPAPATQPVLRSAVFYENTGYGAPTLTVTISSAGELRSIWRFGARSEERKAMLTDAQQAELAALFADGWESLDARYPAPPDGPLYKITYAAKTVEASSLKTPGVFERVRIKISEFVEAASPVK